MSMVAAPVPCAEEVIPRPTAVERPWIVPRLLDDGRPGHDLDDPAVRRFWTALVGPGATADLLRMTRAAVTRRPIREPRHRWALLREQAIWWDGADLWVHRRIPYLVEWQVRRLRPALRAEYRLVLERLADAA
ncbi:MAG: hypothetical protein R3290_11515 [Acidimicrobiia bacterium]|nr:hypothetical protein [Acidimicrobiia bacterium]